MFSVPLNPKLKKNQLNEFISFLKEYKPFIYDFYFTCRVDPFLQDAMGDVFDGGEEDHNYLIELALHIQSETGITASAVFNNTEVRPSQQNLDIFIESFRPVYESGIKSATIPHTHWMATGQIKKAFPELFVKNTILRNVSEPRDIQHLAKAGFDYINLDRDLMRDHEKLKRFKKAKQQYGVKISLLANEGCYGGCIMMDEHYQFNNTRTDGPQYFNDPISRVSCPKWDHEDFAVTLKTANFPPWREDWQQFIDELGIDVIKMHGRESHVRLKETMDIIKRYANNEEILFDSFNDFIEETNMVDKPITIWRNKIKNCKFDCWDCGYCDKIMAVKYGNHINPKVALVAKELVDSVNNAVQIDIPGLTSTRVQSLINGLAKSSSKYLEIGSYQGATAAAALSGNKLEAYFVDMWQSAPQAVRRGWETPVTNTLEEFKENIKPYKGDSKIFISNSDMFRVDVSKISDIDLFFYDGPHDHESTKNAVKYYYPSFANQSILIFDDANWTEVVQGAHKGILESGLNILYSKKVLNSLESDTDWWNGLYIVVVEKNKNA
jgi:thiol-disulfide isomerase/thioredoxin